MKIIRLIAILLALVFCLYIPIHVMAEDTNDSAMKDALNLLQEKLNMQNSKEEKIEIDSDEADKIVPAKPDKDGNIIIDTLELKGMDVLDVLKLISKKSGLNIVAGNDVRGNHG